MTTPFVRRTDYTPNATYATYAARKGSGNRLNKYAEDVESFTAMLEKATDIGVIFSSNIPGIIDFTTGGIVDHDFIGDFNVLSINVLSLHIDTLFRTESGGKVNAPKLETAKNVVNLRTKSVQVFTTSNMTQYFFPPGYAIPQTVYGVYPLVTTNHVLPMHDDFQNVGAFRRRYDKVFTSKVYTNSLVIPRADTISIDGQYVNTRLKVSFTDPVSKSNMVGWRFVATNYKPNPYAFLPNAPSRLYTPTRVMNFVAGPAAGDIVAKDVRCTNLYVKPPSATAFATVEVNGSISCKSLTVGGSNVGQAASMSTAHLMAAMSYLQAKTIFKAFLIKSENSNRLDFQVRAYLFHPAGWSNPWAHIFVRRIDFNIVVATANMNVASEETTYLVRKGVVMIESSTSPGTFYRGDNAVLSSAPQSSNLYITISPTIYANVNAAGIIHSFTNRTTYRSNPTGTRIEVACTPLRVVTPSSWSDPIRL